MRFHLAALVFCAGLAAGASARAQNVSDPAVVTNDCAGDAAATNVEGLPVPAVMPRPDEAPLVDFELCTDDRDPRCAPLAPQPDGPHSAQLGELPRFVGGQPLALPASTFVVLDPTDPLEPTASVGPRGVRTSVERPPRAA